MKDYSSDFLDLSPASVLRAQYRYIPLRFPKIGRDTEESLKILQEQFLQELDGLVSTFSINYLEKLKKRYYSDMRFVDQELLTAINKIKGIK